MAVPAVVPVAVSACAMLEPEDAVAPDTPDCTTVQANVVPVTFPVRAMLGDVPEHTVCEPGVAVVTGVGFTVTTIVMALPVHPLAVGVTV